MTLYREQDGHSSIGHKETGEYFCEEFMIWFIWGFVIPRIGRWIRMKLIEEAIVELEQPLTKAISSKVFLLKRIVKAQQIGHLSWELTPIYVYDFQFFS